MSFTFATRFLSRLAMHAGLAGVGMALVGPILGQGMPPVHVGQSRVTSGFLHSRTAAGGSFLPSISSDGRAAVFLSQARNLVRQDPAEANSLQVYWVDLATGALQWIGRGLSPRTEDGGSSHPVISSNGQFVAFVSRGADGEAFREQWNYVFWRDIESTTTQPISGGTNGGFGRGEKPLLSADGRSVFFNGRYIEGYNRGQTPDVFARDMVEQNTWLISEDLPIQSIGLQYDLLATSRDGRSVVFAGEALYSKERDSGTTTIISTKATNYLDRFPDFWSAAISDDHAAVAFSAPVLNSELTFYYDGLTDTISLIATNPPTLWPVNLSADGRKVCYLDGANVFVWDATTGSRSLVSVNYDGTQPGNGVSKFPVMTPNGETVAFVSKATDLTTNAASPKFQLYARDLVAGVTRLITVNRSGQPSKIDNERIDFSVSDNGQWIVFASRDDELVGDDRNQASDVFARDLLLGETKLLSKAHEEAVDQSQPAGTFLPGRNAVSSNGTVIAFLSFDNQFVAEDTNGLMDLFVRDLSGANLRRVENTSDIVGDPLVSKDGRYLLYTRGTRQESDPYVTGDIYRLDLQTGLSELVTARMDGTPGGLSASPAMTPDGRFIAFESRAAGLVPQGDSIFTNVFLRDMMVKTNYLLSTNASGSFGESYSAQVQFSPNGRFILFNTRSRDLLGSVAGRGYMLRDIMTGIVTPLFWFPPVFYPQPAPAFSPDSKWLVGLNRSYWEMVDLTSVHDTDEWNVFVTHQARVSHPHADLGAHHFVYEEDSSPAPRQVRLVHRLTRTTTPVSRNRFGTADGNGSSTHPNITPDGQFIIYASQASDLVADDTNGLADIFVRDRLQNITLLVSVNGQGQQGNGASSKPVLAADGRTVVFQSFAGNFVSRDYNAEQDIFLLRLGTGDTDQDRLDDDWEMAYFSTLTREGSGDFDHDGHPDVDEFRAGTDPTDAGSILRVMLLRAVSTPAVTLLWPAAQGRVYEAEFTDTLGTGPWQRVSGTVGFTAGTASITDPTPLDRRYYRVRIRDD